MALVIEVVWIILLVWWALYLIIFASFQSVFVIGVNCLFFFVNHWFKSLKCHVSDLFCSRSFTYYISDKLCPRHSPVSTFIQSQVQFEFALKHKALQLSVFFFSFFISFFCQPNRARDFGIVNRYSWFWKNLSICQYCGQRRWVQLFPDCSCNKWYKYWYIHFHKTYENQIWVDWKETNQVSAGDAIRSR